ncbi:Uncharacterised protein [Shigella sonnei]|nr:Uncharacterised protein [Shigella sonnei]
MFCFRGGHFGNALPFAVENAADVGEQNQIRAQRCRQRRCRLVGIDVHQLPFVCYANGADHRQITVLQQGVDKLRRTWLRQSNMT